MATSASQNWNWSNIPTPDPATNEETPENVTGEDETRSSSPDGNATQPEPSPPSQGPPRPRRSNKRMCRICHGVELPTEEAGILDGLRGGERRPRRIYKSEDPELGRLIHPCRCRGSIKYVHEGCLKEFKNHNPSAYTCGSCRHTFALGKLSIAHRVRSPILSLALTLGILFAVVFVLGFVADPILDLWIDPVGTIADTVATGRHPFDEAFSADLEDDEGWPEHFLKGVFSLGLLGFMKAFLAMSPWQWWNIRSTGLAGPARRGGTGRDRVGNISFLLVLIGVLSFLWAVWTGIRKWTARSLDRASERILNYDDNNEDTDDEHGDLEDDDEDDESRKDR